jgi:hypothetical protein
VVWVLRTMSRRFRQQLAVDDSEVPYGPSGLPSHLTSEKEPVGG